MSTLRFNTWQNTGGTEVANSTLGTGKILQVVSATKTDTFTASLAASADTAVTGLSVTITPSSTSSKILVMVNVSMSDDTDAYARAALRLYRDSTSIGEPSAAGSRTTAFLAGMVVQANAANILNLAGNYLDSPATTSATTYAVHAVNLWSSTKSVAVNLTQNDADNGTTARPSSTITVMEVSA